MRTLHHNYARPPFYFTRLLVFFVVLSAVLTSQLIFFTDLTYAEFLLVLIIVLFLMLGVGVLIELSYRGEYMNPLEMYDVLRFVYDFLDIRTDNELYYYYFPKYTKRDKKLDEILQSPHRFFTLSTIRKMGDTYTVTLLDEGLVLGFFFLRFISKRATIHLIVKKVDDEYTIIYAYR